jgi:hypothetical protein
VVKYYLMDRRNQETVTAANVSNETRVRFTNELIEKGFELIASMDYQTYTNLVWQNQKTGDKATIVIQSNGITIEIDSSSGPILRDNS